MRQNGEKTKMTGLESAVIGMAGRFPGAENITEFWQNLKNGVESLVFMSDRELEQQKIKTKHLDNPDFVKTKGGILEDIAVFDALFFDYSPKEAELMDPQMRLFHECTWEALEDAGYNPDSYDGLIGIYAGASINMDWQARSILSGRSETLGHFEASQLYNKDFLCTRAAYRMNLRGPALTIQTACSTSLVAIHLACRALLMGECDIALAGGVSIVTSGNNGYIYQEGMIFSPDGHCRTFDARARGTVAGSGIGIVVLKKLKKAIVDRDHIRATVLASVINNDGKQKVGFTAPSVEVQASLIKKVLYLSQVEPESITYIEAHGTATMLGDPIEVEALKQAFNTSKKGYCRIGSVKTNIGHLDCAAGVASFIKTVLALENRLIPPSLHFEASNWKIDFENSPFIVNTGLLKWKNDKYPLRAGVSSFGIGGTNAHVVLEESPKKEESLTVREWQLILLSAKTETALKQASKNLAEFLKKNTDINMTDMAYTLQIGRKHFQHRCKFVCSSAGEAIEILASSNSRRLRTAAINDEKKRIVFMFPGLGPQYINMGSELYQKERVFRQEIDRCFEILKELVNFDLKEILYPVSEAAGDIHRFDIAQLAIFVFEYALARLLMEWGIKPDAMIGYSIGEYTATCLSGVLSLEDTLKVLVKRGELIMSIPDGAMLSVPLPSEQLGPLLEESAPPYLAIDNGLSCIISGPAKEIDAFEEKMKKRKLVCVRLKASHAIHSREMAPVLEALQETVSHVELKKPKIPYISNLTGTWLKDEQAVDPAYWGLHLARTVHFAEGIEQLLTQENMIFLEVGPDRELCTLLAGQSGHGNQRPAINLVQHQLGNMPDIYYLLSKIGQLWLYGLNIDWHAFYRQETRYRVPLPTYPFEGKPYWIDGKALPVSRLQAADDLLLKKKNKVSEWFYYPSWTRSLLDSIDNTSRKQTYNWLIFCSPDQFCRLFIQRLKQYGHTVVPVTMGLEFASEENHDGTAAYTIHPGKGKDYQKLLEELANRQKVPGRIVHFWGLSGKSDHDTANRGIHRKDVDRALVCGFYSLLHLTRALAKQTILEEIDLNVVSNNLYEVTGGEVICPQKATILGPLKVIPQEYPFIRCRSVDIILPEPGSSSEAALVEQFIHEFITKSPDTVLAYRNNHRWVQTFKPVRLGKVENPVPRLKERGVYLITGGLGKIGLTLAEYLAETVNARLILMGRQPLPPRDQWEQQLTHADRRNRTALKIRKLQQVEAKAAGVLIDYTNITDFEGMQAVIARAEDAFGPINGVIHAAGDTGPSIMRSVEQVEATDCKRQFTPKIYGLLNLEKVLRNKNPDFCWLTSSLSPVLGGLGFSAYAAANSFMDAFVYRYNRQEPKRWISVNWADWNFEHNHPGIPAQSAETAQYLWRMLPTEGIETFRRILTHGNVPQVVVSTVDLQTRIDKWVKLESLRDEKVQEKTTHLHRERPFLENPYIKPSTHIEQIIAEVLQDFLGIREVGIEDNFFELGATSLNIIQINNLVRKKIKQDISVMLWFEYPTIKALARHLVQGDAGITPSHQEIDRSETIKKGKNKLIQVGKKSRN